MHRLLARASSSYATRSFSTAELRACYAAEAVFDDPCGTIRTPAGIVRGFELIHALFDVRVLESAEWTYHPKTHARPSGPQLSEDALPGEDAQRVARRERLFFFSLSFSAHVVSFFLRRRERGACFLQFPGREEKKCRSKRPLPAQARLELRAVYALFLRRPEP